MLTLKEIYSTNEADLPDRTEDAHSVEEVQNSVQQAKYLFDVITKRIEQGRGLHTSDIALLAVTLAHTQVGINDKTGYKKILLEIKRYLDREFGHFINY